MTAAIRDASVVNVLRPISMTLAVARTCEEVAVLTGSRVAFACSGLLLLATLLRFCTSALAVGDARCSRTEMPCVIVD